MASGALPVIYASGSNFDVGFQIVSYIVHSIVSKTSGTCTTRQSLKSFVAVFVRKVPSLKDERTLVRFLSATNQLPRMFFLNTKNAA